MILHRISLQFFSICFVLSGKLIKMLGGSVKLRGQHTRCVGGNVGASGQRWAKVAQRGWLRITATDCRGPDNAASAN